MTSKWTPRSCSLKTCGASIQWMRLKSSGDLKASYCMLPWQRSQYYCCQQSHQSQLGFCCLLCSYPPADAQCKPSLCNGGSWTRYNLSWYRDRAHLSLTHTGGENNQWLSIDFVLCEGACCQSVCQQTIKKMPKSCCVVGCTTNRLKNPELSFYKLPNRKNKLLRREKWTQAIGCEAQSSGKMGKLLDPDAVCIPV